MSSPGGPVVLAAGHFSGCSGNVCVTDDLVRRIFGFNIQINDLWAMVIAALVVGGSGLVVARRSTAGVPGKAQLLWETVVGSIEDQVEERIGPTGRRVVPLAITLFAFILIANWLEIFWPAGHDPNYLPTPTSNVNVDYIMALTVFVFTNGTAIKRAGLGRYVKHYFQPFSWMFIFNIAEELAKPLSLALRLFGNVFAGALILALIAGLFPYFIIPVADIVWVPFDLGIFAIQAFIFALLAIIYYQQAVSIAEGSGH